MKENEEGTQSGSLNDEWGAAFEETRQAQSTAKKDEVEARPASFSNLKPENSGAVTNIDMLLDIPLTVSVEIGRTRLLVKDLLQLGQGAVIELEKLAGEPMEILVNGRLIARGEAVVVNEKFGVKLTDIVSPSERISRLK
ncbi:MAG: flagellar motor switch protein FliN [Deltaproteobacteria bacterium]|nr:flagellar motor switch protein FliN [Deltaproteobacteria bacterium]MBZ0219286.1 flagellar motor switch protein FliN [Deltaproteobacteria bacterium]